MKDKIQSQYFYVGLLSVRSFIFFNCSLAAPRPILGHFWRSNLSNLICTLFSCLTLGSLGEVWYLTLLYHFWFIRKPIKMKVCFLFDLKSSSLFQGICVCSRKKNHKILWCYPVFNYKAIMQLSKYFRKSMDFLN